MSNLLSLSFWFNMRPPALTPLFVKVFLILVIIILVLAIIFKILQNKKGGIYAFLYRKLANLFFSNFVIGILILFFNYEAVPFLAMRFFFIVWFLEMAVWLFFVLIKIKEIPKRKKQLEQDKEYRKYIP